VSAGAQAQTPPALDLAAGAPIPGGVSRAGQLMVIGSLAPIRGRSSGGRYDLTSGVVPGPAPAARLYLPQLAR
jgi:hypothetical protein